MLAKLVRFYHVPPKIFTDEMPSSLADHFIAAMPYLEAMEEMRAMQVADYPHITPEGRRKAWGRLSLPIEMLFPARVEHDDITALRRSMLQRKRKRKRKK